MKTKRFSFVTKVTLLTGILMILGMFTIAVSLNYFFIKTIETFWERDTASNLAAFSATIDEHKDMAMKIARIFADNKDISTMLEKKDYAAVKQELKRVAEESKIDFITITDAQGTVLARSYTDEKGDNIGNQQSITSAQQGAGISTIEKGTLVRLSSRASMPIKDNSGKVVAVVTTGEDLSKPSIVDNFKEKFGMEATIFVDDERLNTTIVQDGKRIVGTKLLGSIAERVIGKKESYNGRAPILGEDYITAYKPIISNNEVQGVLFVGNSLSEVYAMRNKMFLFSAAVTGCAVLIVGVILFWFLRRQLNPIREIGILINKIADGDLTANYHIERNDEIGELCNNIARMVNHLQQMVGHISNKAESVSSSTAQLQNSANEVSDSVAVVANAVGEAAAETTVQSESVQKITATTMAMASSVEQTKNAINKVTGLSVKASAEANDGNSVLQNAVTQMQNIGNNVDKLNSAVHKMNTSTSRIDEIILVITEIAGQTNLLALNAAIEAARAGEHGRGFAVVAEEVRKLAEQSEHAAKEIGTLINEVNGVSHEVSKDMDNAVVAVHKGREMVSEAGEAFNHINNVVAEVSKETKDIENTIFALAESSSDIMSKMQHSKNITQQLLQQMTDVAASTEQQTATMDEVAGVIANIAQMSKDMLNEVKKFKLKSK